MADLGIRVDRERFQQGIDGDEFPPGMGIMQGHASRRYGILAIAHAIHPHARGTIGRKKGGSGSSQAEFQGTLDGIDHGHALGNFLGIPIAKDALIGPILLLFAAAVLVVFSIGWRIIVGHQFQKRIVAVRPLLHQGNEAGEVDSGREWIFDFT